MKLQLKHLAGVLLVGLAIVLIVKVNSWINPPDEPHTIVVPGDSAFTPIEHDHYQPPSLPFTGKKSPFKLPSNVSERDVDRVVTVETRGDSSGKHPIHIIETKDGEIYVEKDSTISRVTVTEFQPPLFSFGLRFGGGLSVSKHGERAVVSPCAVFAPLEWSGWLHLPTAVVDLDGMGFGAQARVYHDIFLGISNLKRYDEGTMLKASLVYMF
jgi:hypothetical protein